MTDYQGVDVSKTTRLTCNRCGNPMYFGNASKQGRARCHECRRTEQHTRTCAQCGATFTVAKPSIKTKYCSLVCVGEANGDRCRIRSVEDPYVQRHRREGNAVGLSARKRRTLLAKWKRQGRTCAYCDTRADTIDHVVPLVRGGTNYEGNLVPCCKSCNSRKSGHTVIEWRTGLRLPPMNGTLRRKPKQQPTQAPTCVGCHVQITHTRDSPYCTKECANHAEYRTQIGELMQRMRTA